jgi:hypothetical protein
MPMVTDVCRPTSAVPGIEHEWAVARVGHADDASSATMATVRPRRIRFTVVTLLAASAAALAFAVAWAAPAAAHGVSSVGPSNFQTVLETVEPDVAGVRIRVIELGSRLEVVNTTDQEVVVLGYQDEPYLRIGPDGVFENVRSPATYLNATRKGTGALPAEADPSATPSWRRTADEAVARWHDHRVHWMGDRPPPAVRRDAGRRHVIEDAWRVPMRVGSTAVVVTGRLLWVPGPSPLPWLAVALALAAAVAAAGGFVLRGGGLRALLALGALVVLVSDLVHTFGSASAVETALSLSWAVLLAWLAAAAAVVLLLWPGGRRETEGMLAAAFAGTVMAVFGGLADLSTFSRSQLPFDGSPLLARACVAVSLGAGFGMAAAVVLSRRRAAAETGAGGEPVASPA